MGRSELARLTAPLALPPIRTGQRAKFRPEAFGKVRQALKTHGVGDFGNAASVAV
jgi:hypothetical protein